AGGDRAALHPRCRDRDRGSDIPVARTRDASRRRTDPPVDVSRAAHGAHAVLLRSPRAQGSVRPAAPEPATGWAHRRVILFAVQTPAPDSIRRALRTVFAAREYTWQDRFDPMGWVREQFARFSD